MINYKDILNEKKFFIFICPGSHIKTHSHDFLELAYVLSGEAEHTRDDNTVEIKEGDYFVVDYNSRHSYTAKTKEFQLINCLFKPELIDLSLVNCRSLSTLMSSYQIHFSDVFFASSPSESIFKDNNGSIKRLLLDMLSEFQAKEPGYLQIIRSKTIEVLVQTMRKICINANDKKSESSIDEILKLINNEYMNDIALMDICKKVGYSFAYLSAKVKKETGLSFTHHLQRIRIEQSMRLLTATDKTINEIAFAVGYKDIKSFYAVFKKVADTTPAKFRKNYRQNS